MLLPISASMGVPTIGSRIYGLSDAVVDGETGILVNPRDAEDLRGGMELLLSNADLRFKMGALARRRACALFSSELVNKGLIDEYKFLLKKKMCIYKKYGS